MQWRPDVVNVTHRADAIAPDVAGRVHLSWRGMVPHVAVARVERRGNRLSRFHNRWNRAACFHVSGTGCAAVEVGKRMRAAMSDGR